jgi:high-affinity nickel permease
MRRHAFDADHISAVDNTTRKVLGERQGTGEPLVIYSVCNNPGGA